MIASTIWLPRVLTTVASFTLRSKRFDSSASYFHLSFLSFLVVNLVCSSLLRRLNTL
jgi:hypothetical protein